MDRHFEKYCLQCGQVIDDPALFFCQDCGGNLSFRYDDSRVEWDNRFVSMWRYWRLLPIEGVENLVTLNEGATPLIPALRYRSHSVFLKDELRNPTGSHKDRPLAVAINHACSLKAAASFVVSTGSTGISNAAFAARAGIRSVVIMSVGTPPERVYPMFALGSTVVEVHGDVDVLVDEVIRICRANGLYLSSTSRASNPYQAEGSKTIAYELVEQLGHAPDWVVITVGGGGTLSGVWRGFQDLHRIGRISSMPRLVGVVPRDYNALEQAFARGLETWDEVRSLPFPDPPPSILVKLAHIYPPDGMEALDAVRASGGFFASVSDAEALDGLTHIGHEEGLYVEPSTSACLPVIDQMIESGLLRPDETLVALMCGSGFRETFTAIERSPIVKQTTMLANLGELLNQL